jgi:hypothetical protein
LCSYSIVKILKLKSLKNINDKHKKSLIKRFYTTRFSSHCRYNFVPDSWICRTIWRTPDFERRNFYHFWDLFSYYVHRDVV